MVARAYKATNIKVLENKIRIIPIDNYIEKQIINVHRKKRPKVDNMIIDACKQICDHLKRKQGKTESLKITFR